MMPNTLATLTETDRAVAEMYPETQDSSPKGRLLHATVVLCSMHGFLGVTVRDITARAETNLAAVSYYYESKDNLIKAAIETASRPINAMMLAELAEYEALIGEGQLEAGPIWNALAGPLVRCCADPTTWLAHLASLYIRAALKPNSPNSVVSSSHDTDAMMRRFLKALGRALPHLTPEELQWRFYFAWGAILTATRDNSKDFYYRRFTKGVCDTGDFETMLKHLVSFATAAFSK